MDVEGIREHSRDVAALFGVEIPSFLPLLYPVPHLKPEKAIVERLLCIHVIAACAYGLDRRKGLDWIEQERLAHALTEQENRFLAGGSDDVRSLQFLVERLWALSWALNLISELNLLANVPQNFVHLMPNLKQSESSSSLRNRIKLRTIEEIFPVLDLVYCFHWAVRDAKINKMQLQLLEKSHLIVERRHALEWVVRENGWEEMSLDT